MMQEISTSPEWCSAEQWEKIQNNTIPEDEFSELVFNNFFNSGSDITEDEMYSIEENFSSYGPTRRAALAILKQTGNELSDAVIEDRDFAIAMADMHDCAQLYAEKLEAFAELMKTASVRASLALCSRKDMREIMDEARKDH